MKPTFFFIALLLAVVSTSAFAQTNKANALRTLHFSDSFTSLTVEDDLTVILTDDTVPDIKVEGSADVVMAKETEGNLFLYVRNGSTAADVKVYVPGRLLSKIFMNGKGTLGSATTLQ